MAIRTMTFIDGGWMFHNKRHLLEAFDSPDFDVDYKKIPLLIREHLKKVTGSDIDNIRTNFFGSMPINKPDFNPSRQKAFYKYLREECFFEAEVFDIDYQNDDDLKPRDKSLNIAFASSIMGNAALNTFDVAAFIAGDPDYIPLIKRLRMLGKRILLVGLKDSMDTRLQSKIGMFDFPTLFLDENLEYLKLERNDHYRECMACGEAELTNWHGAEFYCSNCRENDNRMALRTCDSCGKVEETTWSENYYYCFECRESHRKTSTAPAIF